MKTTNNLLRNDTPENNSGTSSTVLTVLSHSKGEFLCMMQRIKRVVFIPICLVIISLISSCAYTSMSRTITLQSGDTIRVTLETTGGYSFSFLEDGSILVKKGSQEISKGGFFTDLDFDTYIDGSAILEASPEDSPSCFLFQLESDSGLVYCFLQQIDDSSTSVSMFVDSLSFEDTHNLFQRLSFEKVDEN